MLRSWSLFSCSIFAAAPADCELFNKQQRENYGPSLLYAVQRSTAKSYPS